MPFGFWVLGNSAWKNPPYRQPICLKFLSAFGFWGTIIKKTDGGRVMASLKCLSAFGFWGTEDGTIEVPAGGQSLKCLSAFGFWGTAEALGSGIKKASIVSNAFRLLGSGEPRNSPRNKRVRRPSQMPFGFWVLGNCSLENPS